MSHRPCSFTYKSLALRGRYDRACKFVFYFRKEATEGKRPIAIAACWRLLLLLRARSPADGERHRAIAPSPPYRRRRPERPSPGGADAAPPIPGTQGTKMEPVAVVFCESERWGVPDGTRRLLTAAELAGLPLEYFDEDFGEWFVAARPQEVVVGPQQSIKARLTGFSPALPEVHSRPTVREPEPALEPEPEPEPEPGPEPGPEPEPEPPAGAEVQEAVSEEQAAETEAAKVAWYARASSRRGGVSSRRQTTDVMAEEEAAARAVGAAAAAARGPSGVDESGKLLALELVCGARVPAKDISVGNLRSIGDIINRTSDPYALLQLCDPSGTPVGPRRRSPTKLKTLNPVWRFYCDFPLGGAAAAAAADLLLHIEVRDHNLGRSDEFMCAALVPVGALESGAPLRFGASTAAAAQHHPQHPQHHCHHPVGHARHRPPTAQQVWRPLRACWRPF
jgi:hypothetical protein